MFLSAMGAHEDIVRLLMPGQAFQWAEEVGACLVVALKLLEQDDFSGADDATKPLAHAGHVPSTRQAVQDALGCLLNNSVP